MWDECQMFLGLALVPSNRNNYLSLSHHLRRTQGLHIFLDSGSMKSEFR